MIDNLQQIVNQNTKLDPLYLRNLLKEQLQFYLLNFIYNSRWGENLLFKGGSCLRMFFDLPRLSEDLDLDYVNEKTFVLPDFMADLKDYFSKTLQYKDLGSKVSSGENIIYLKFPVLDQLGLVKSPGESRTLFLRIDLAVALGKQYQSEISLKSTFDFSFLVKRYSLADLFSGKIAAILGRVTNEENELIPRVKGRDYFDLAWFLEKKVTPNLAYLAEITNIETTARLKKELEEKIRDLDLTVLRQDLLPLFKDGGFVENFTKNYQKVTLDLLRYGPFDSRRVLT